MLLEGKPWCHWWDGPWGHLKLQAQLRDGMEDGMEDRMSIPSHTYQCTHTSVTTPTGPSCRPLPIYLPHSLPSSSCCSSAGVAGPSLELGRAWKVPRSVVGWELGKVQSRCGVLSLPCMYKHMRTYMYTRAHTCTCVLHPSSCTGQKSRFPGAANTQLYWGRTGAGRSRGVSVPLPAVGKVLEGEEEGKRGWRGLRLCFLPWRWVKG